MFDAARVPAFRTFREFAEQEIIIPNGPFEGHRFNGDRLPWAGLWLDAIEWALEHEINRFNLTGPTQAGKSLLGYVIPALTVLFEWGETMVLGLPDMNMASDKWTKDLYPVLNRTRYARHMPTVGGGSRGGTKMESVDFTNGASLRFMSGGGGDKQRAGYTSRVLGITETDGLEESTGGSAESNKINQLEGRLRAWGAKARIFKECTVTIATAHTWRIHQMGTTSGVAMPCPHCRRWVAPEREHLKGWQDAESVIDARANSHFICPTCSKTISDRQREIMNRRGVLVHRGQTVTKAGKVRGKIPRTDTLSMRFTAFTNLLSTPGDLGVDEWNGARATDEDDAEKKLCQQVWCIPWEQKDLDNTKLDEAALLKRKGRHSRGIVPPKPVALTCGVDVGGRLLHWMAVAWFKGASSQVIDYGRIEVPSADMATEDAILNALFQFDDRANEGWPVYERADIITPKQIWIDSRWQGGGGGEIEPVYEFCKRKAAAVGSVGLRGVVYRPSLGHGAAQSLGRRYTAPRSKTKTIRYIGHNFHVTQRSEKGVFTVDINADYWKTWLRNRLIAPDDSPGAMQFFNSPNRNEHFTLKKHLTAEEPDTVFVPGAGLVTTWKTLRSTNHYLDCAYLACAAGWLAGARLFDNIAAAPPPTKPQVAPTQFTTPDGRPFLVTER